MRRNGRTNSQVEFLASLMRIGAEVHLNVPRLKSDYGQVIVDLEQGDRIIFVSANQEHSQRLFDEATKLVTRMK